MNNAALKKEIRSKSNEIVTLIEQLKNNDNEAAEATALYVSESLTRKLSNLFPPRYIPKEDRPVVRFFDEGDLFDILVAFEKRRTQTEDEEGIKNTVRSF